MPQARAQDARADQVGVRNGHALPRFTFSVGTVDVRRPQVRNLEERFVSRVLPFFQWQSQDVRQLLPDLYLHGLANKDFALALRGLWGEASPLSASSLQRLKEKWEAKLSSGVFPLEEAQLAYLWVDGFYMSRPGWAKRRPPCSL